MAPTVMIGQNLGRYRIVEKIGEGGMGVVYRAHDEHLSRDVAVKVLSKGTLADAGARRRFRKEALLLSSLNHLHVATIHDFDTQDGVDFLAMEYIAGQTLAELLAAGRPAETESVELAIQLVEGLAAAHAKGIVHRDLKPANVRLTPDGVLKILDFGLAKAVTSSEETAATESASYSITSSAPCRTCHPSNSGPSRWTSAPTSTRSGSCCSSWRPAVVRSRNV